MPAPQRLHEIARRVAALAPGKRVRLVSGGASLEIPLAPEPANVAPPDPIVEVSKQLSARDAEIRDLLLKASERTDGALKEVKDAVVSVAVGQAEVVQSVNENTRTLHLPVKPVYDKDGKVMAAQRVKELEA